MRHFSGHQAAETNTQSYRFYDNADDPIANRASLSPRSSLPANTSVPSKQRESSQGATVRIIVVFLASVRGLRAFLTELPGYQQDLHNLHALCGFPG